MAKVEAGRDRSDEAANEGALRTIAVIGSTGLVGRQLVQRLVSSGHRVVEVSRESGADLLTGEGLEEALSGVDTVIDVINSPTPEDSSEGFFERTAKNLASAVRGAEVRHYVVLSIVGAGALAPLSGYMRGKLLQESAAEGSGVPWTVMRSTQFHELAGSIVESLIVDDTVRVPRASLQTAASRELVEILARTAVGDAHNAIVEFGGPEKQSFADVARTVLAHQGRSLEIVDDPDATYFGLPVDDTTLVPTSGTRGITTLSDWLARG
jgi:uncharacterized protein YbjT (DUF2867 family)